MYIMNSFVTLHFKTIPIKDFKDFSKDFQCIFHC